MLAYCASAISPHMGVMKNGALVCLGAVLARIGEEKYYGSELGLPTDDLVTVLRTPSEVFDAAALASFEGAIVTDKHPPTFVTPSNWSWYGRGHIQNIRISPDGQSILGDVIVNDESLIAKIRSGVRDLSAGYDTDYIPLRDGRYMQTRIRGNHIAVVERGRWPNTRLMDSEGEPKVATSKDSKMLVDKINEIRRSASDVEELSRPNGMGPAQFHLELARRNSAYASFFQAAEAGQKFSDDARAAGEAMAARFLPKSAQRVCRNPVTATNDGEEDWAAMVNRRGRELRK